MIIDGKQIAQSILEGLKSEIDAYPEIQPPRLAVFTVNPTDDTQLFMRNKRRAAEKIGAECMLIQYNKAPRFEDFANKISKFAQDPSINGIIIQEPLPSSLSTVTIFDYIPLMKEIEGFKNKSTFDHPLSMAVLCCLKYVFDPTHSIEDLKNITFERHSSLIKAMIKNKKIVLIGRGKTGGKPIAETLTTAKIPYININSKTPTPEEYISQAHIIITAVGKKTVTAHNVSPNAVLIGVGMHKENDKWKGDYDNNEVADKVLAYTPTPGGIGPMNVAFLMKNLIKAWKIQNNLDEENTD